MTLSIYLECSDIDPISLVLLTLLFFIDIDYFEISSNTYMYVYTVDETRNLTTCIAFLFRTRSFDFNRLMHYLNNLSFFLLNKLGTYRI